MWKNRQEVLALKLKFHQLKIDLVDMQSYSNHYSSTNKNGEQSIII